MPLFGVGQCSFVLEKSAWVPHTPCFAHQSKSRSLAQTRTAKANMVDCSENHKPAEKQRRCSNAKMCKLSTLPAPPVIDTAKSVPKSAFVDSQHHFCGSPFPPKIQFPMHSRCHRCDYFPVVDNPNGFHIPDVACLAPRRSLPEQMSIGPVKQWHRHFCLNARRRLWGVENNAVCCLKTNNADTPTWA